MKKQQVRFPDIVLFSVLIKVGPSQWMLGNEVFAVCVLACRGLRII